MKNIKGILASFVLLIVVGMLVTFTTKNIISHKREELYSYQASTSGTTPSTDETTNNNGPMSNIMTKERYLEPIKAEEEVIADLWSGISDENSIMRVVHYEQNYWDNQLDNILEMYYDIQQVEDIDALNQEHTAFVAERERLSQDAAKAAGETFNGQQFGKEYARLTKEKTYELIERYFAEE